ncbi:MAG TPA: hypothetical protein DDW52_21125 [Planctomycetaceae bacterium]|nr:hypothetical protein [Planctomycetaceae bacterium]
MRSVQSRFRKSRQLTLQRLTLAVVVVAGIGQVADAQIWPFSKKPCDTGACNESSLWSTDCQDLGFCGRHKQDYYRNKMWPVPFRAQDTRSVMSYFDAQRNKGWQLHNTVGTAMYQPGTGQLTNSGLAHLHWIVNKAPQQRRTVFILQAETAEETAARVESTQLAISKLVPVGPLPQLYLTNREAPGSSGLYQTSINRAMTTSVPSPRLGQSSAGGTTNP